MFADFVKSGSESHLVIFCKEETPWHWASRAKKVCFPYIIASPMPIHSTLDRSNAVGHSDTDCDGLSISCIFYL